MTLPPMTDEQEIRSLVNRYADAASRRERHDFHGNDHLHGRNYDNYRRNDHLHGWNDDHDRGNHDHGGNHHHADHGKRERQRKC